jgi:hypothetical protein
MVFNLPRVMVTIARHFHYRSIGHSVPSGLSLLKLRLDKPDFHGFWNPQELKQLAFADAALARHRDAYDLHGSLAT